MLEEAVEQRLESQHSVAAQWARRRGDLTAASPPPTIRQSPSVIAGLRWSKCSDVWIVWLAV